MSRFPDLDARAAFAPSLNGFAFANRWPHVPPLRFRLGGPVPIELGVGDAAFGLCGGMALAALDLYLAGVVPPRDATLPEAGSAEFRYIARRQLDSFELGLTPARFYLLGAPWRSAGSRAGEVLGRELPRIRRELAAGRPVILGLVHAVSANPAELLRNHQVVATGLEPGPEPGSLAIRVYDPNLPGDDTVRLVVTRTDAGALRIDYPAGALVAAFFRQGYRPRDPVPWR
jgi:hypothetical protein